MQGVFSKGRDMQGVFSKGRDMQGVLSNVFNLNECCLSEVQLTKPHTLPCALQECLIELFQEMFGEDSVPKIFKGEKLYVAVNNVKANVDLVSLVSGGLLTCLVSAFSA